MNYLFPHNWFQVPAELSPDEVEFVNQVQEICRAPVSLLSYGPESTHIVKTGLGG